MGTGGLQKLPTVQLGVGDVPIVLIKDSFWDSMI